jgi:hypothetical protein
VTGDLSEWRKRKLKVSLNEQKARDSHPSAKSITQAKDEVAALIVEENIRHEAAVRSEDAYHNSRVFDLEQLYMKIGVQS